MSTFDEIARASPEYVEALYQQFRRDPASVDERWALLFKGYEFGQASGPSDGSQGTGGQAVADLVHGYRELGYLVADVDPLARGHRRPVEGVRVRARVWAGRWVPGAGWPGGRRPRARVRGAGLAGRGGG